VRLDDRAGDIEAEPERPPPPLLHLPEAVEDYQDLVRFQAGSGIADADLHNVVHPSPLHRDPASVRSELQRVVDQVVEDLNDAAWVEARRERVGPDPRVECD
jgi:hypothetical protein